MRVLNWLLVLVVTGGMALAETTNLIEVLREYQKALDAKEAVKPAKGKAVEPAKNKAVEPVKPAAAVTNSGSSKAQSVPVRQPAALAAPAAKPAGERRLGERDVVTVEVAGEPEMSVERGVLGSGGVLRMPVVGEVGMGGKTVAEAEEAMRSLLARDYLVDPKVKLRLVEAARYEFIIRQHVTRPGTYAWSGGETMTLLRAIGMAGGATRSAVLSNVVVRRVVDGKEQELKVDLEAMNRDRSATPFVLRPGDVVEVGGR